MIGFLANIDGVPFRANWNFFEWAVFKNETKHPRLTQENWEHLVKTGEIIQPDTGRRVEL